MTRLLIPSIHLPNGREILKPLGYRPSLFRKILKCYAERGLLQCSPADHIALPFMPDREYLDFLLGLGFGTENITVSEGNGGNFSEDILSAEKVLAALSKAAKKAESLHFYIHLEEEREMVRLMGLEDVTMHPELTRLFNTLYFLVRVCEDLDLPMMPRTQIRSNRFLHPILKLMSETGPLFVRGNESVGGSQVYIIRNEQDAMEADHRIRRNSRVTRYFASPLWDMEESWNVQYYFTREGFSLVGASKQLLNDRCGHKGNQGGESPPPRLADCAKILAERLHEMGARGCVGFDIAMHGETPYPVEINARDNTSSPILQVFNSLSSTLNGIRFMTMGISVPHDFAFKSLLRKTGTADLLNRSSGRGFIPYHIAASRHTGKVDLAIFGQSTEEIADMAERLYKTICYTCVTS